MPAEREIVLFPASYTGLENEDLEDPSKLFPLGNEVYWPTLRMLAVSVTRTYLNTPTTDSRLWGNLMVCWARYINGYADLKRIDYFGDEIVAEWWRKKFSDTRILSDEEKGVIRV
jgi:hypothetical protein